MSCASAGNCTAGGHALDSSGHYQAFVVSQVGGKWGKAKEIPGIASILQSAIFSVSCASAGNCTAVGFYEDSSRTTQGLLLTQTSPT